MNYQLYGYLIDKDFHFDIENRCLYRLSASGSEKNLLFGALFLNQTMMNVLLYLLQNGRSRSVPKGELLKKIWEEHNLSPSTQRLWQVLTSLNKKLTTLGIPEGFIYYSKGEGYRIVHNDIVPLYKKAAA
ncbi:TPA: winged helix-turn-helix domain-containing protein [Citrobacter sedlakii]|uniref:winged helix-turn-helix domain-containing protein n=1 Tax=Citrobacter sedlakii TaxID=67826 RepID=UPI00228ABFC5|nr:helix-turn-helix domain-containing protein [Citrobacter sedlakii]MEB0951059.1 helix-turn-helix domain-containing protein [Citrobacter sedlakii]HCU0295284.1 winged helix-turn-helix domain-containing protein [Citrobacter sedlakii]